MFRSSTGFRSIHFWALLACSLSPAFAVGSEAPAASAPTSSDSAIPPPNPDAGREPASAPVGGSDAGGAAPAPAAVSPSEAKGGCRAALGKGSIELRPARVRPGDLFEVHIAGPFDSGAVSVGFRDERFSVFAAGPGRLRGFAAVPADAPQGKSAVAIATGDGDGAARAQLELAIQERPTEAITLKVDPKFTHPSKAEREKIAADNKAIALAYQVTFGPPQFTSNFAEPRGGAPRNSRFGERRVFNGALKSRHLGLDVDGKTGDPVRAANDGVVRLARDCFYSGNTVLVSHGAGLFTGYFHLSKVLVKAGQKVKKGELIGLLGSTGRATGPHLHFAAKLEGTIFDPEALLGFDFFAAGATP